MVEESESAADAVAAASSVGQPRRKVLGGLAAGAGAAALAGAFVTGCGPKAPVAGSGVWSGKPGDPNFDAADRLAIIAVVHAYSRFVDNGEYDKYFSLFVDDVVFQFGDTEQSGADFRAKLRKRFENFAAQGFQRRHLMCNVMFLEQTSTTARIAVDALLANIENKTKFSTVTTIVYEGLFEKRDGVWMITRWKDSPDIPLPP